MSHSLPLSAKPLACYSDSHLSLKSWNKSLMTQDCVSLCYTKPTYSLIDAQALSLNNSVMIEDVLGVRTGIAR